MRAHLFVCPPNFYTAIEDGDMPFLPIYNLEHSGAKEWQVGDLLTLNCANTKECIIKRITIKFDETVEYHIDDVNYLIPVSHGTAYIGLAEPNTHSLTETF